MTILSLDQRDAKFSGRHSFAETSLPPCDGEKVLLVGQRAVTKPAGDQDKEVDLLALLSRQD